MSLFTALVTIGLLIATPERGDQLPPTPGRICESLSHNFPNKPSAGIRACSDALRFNLKDTEVLFARSYSYLMAKQYKEAIEDLTAILTSYQSSEAYRIRGYAYWRIGDRDKALSDFNGSLIVNPRNYIALSQRGELRDDQGEHALAIADLSASIAIRPDYHWAWYDRAHANLHAGNYDAAIRDFDNTLRVMRDNSEGPDVIASVLVTRGTVRARLNSYDNAIADYSEALTLSPKNYYGFVFRAIAYRHKGDYQSAFADCNRAIQVDPDRATAYNARGTIQRASGHIDAAIADYSYAIRLKPGDPVSYVNRSVAYSYKEDFERAIRDTAVALKLKPDYPVALNDRCWYRAILEKGLPAALADCNEAIKREPKASYFGSRALVYLRLAEYRMALDDSNTAIKLGFAEPQDTASSYLIRAIAKQHLGDVKGSTDDAKKAAEMDAEIAGKMKKWRIEL
jgi:tetratricopeptide (TPR) repeat protein